MDLDLEYVSRDKIPAELEQLSTVFSYNLEPEHAQFSNTVKLLKCTKCGTYYYFNHYVDEEERFMDPTSNDMTVRRYTPLMVIRFLEGITKSNEIFPLPLGKIKKIFYYDVRPPNEIRGDEWRGKMGVVVRELDEIKGRYNTLIENFINVVKTQSPEWHLKKYIVDSLVMHFVNEEDWNSISELLLKHKDPIIRCETLNFLVDFSSDDAPILDIIHIPYDIREKLEKILNRKRQLNEVIQVANELALSDHGYTYKYDYNFKCYKHPIQYSGLHHIRLLGRYGDHSQLISKLVSLLSKENKSLNYNVCWTLSSLCTEKATYAEQILDCIKKVDEKILRDKEVQELIQKCKKQEKTTKEKKPKKKISQQK